MRMMNVSSLRTREREWRRGEEGRNKELRYQMCMKFYLANTIQHTCGKFCNSVRFIIHHDWSLLTNACSLIYTSTAHARHSKPLVMPELVGGPSSRCDGLALRPYRTFLHEILSSGIYFLSTTL